MPIAIEAGGRYPITLLNDQKKEPKPVFYFRFLTGRQQRKLLAAYDVIGRKSILEGSDLEALFNGLREFLLDWENMPLAYDPAALEDLISLTEAMELYNHLLLQAPGMAEKKT